MASRKLTSTLTAYDATPSAIAFNPQETALAIGDENGDLYLVDVATGQETVADSSIGGWTELAFSPDGKTLAALVALPGGGNNTIQLYRIGYPAS